MRPVVAFFNNRGGVGKATLTYHVAWMLRELGASVLAVDLDPQAILTSAFLDDETVEQLWDDVDRRTVYGAIAPLFEGEGGVGEPYVHEVAPGLGLVPGDLMLSGTEQELSTAWPNAQDGNKRAFRVLAAFASAARQAAERSRADVVLLDVGPNLGALNRAAMVASDHVVVPLSPDLYGLQGLRNLGPTLRTWRDEWHSRQARGPDGLWLPQGEMRPAGYVVLQRGVRIDRVVGAYDRWLRRVPGEYRRAVLGEKDSTDVPPAAEDPQCLGLLKHYHSLGPMGQEARRPGLPAPLRGRCHRSAPAGGAGRLPKLRRARSADPERRGGRGAGPVSSRTTGVCAPPTTWARRVSHDMGPSGQRPSPRS